MRFEGSRTLDLPLQTVWQGLHSPDVIAKIIPNCARIERQPRYRPEDGGDFALGFEIGTVNEQTGEEPIIGWLEIDRQSHYKHLAVTITLNDSLTFLRAEGTIDLHSKDNGEHTAIQYHFDVRFPGMRGVGWSANAHANAENVIDALFERLPYVVTELGLRAYTETVNQKSDRPQLLNENVRGSIVLLPAVKDTTPSQSMLRRVEEHERQSQARQQRTITLWSIGGIVASVGIFLLWQFSHKSPTPTE